MAMSMTGFGAADGLVNGRRVRVEIRTVNHRFFNLSARLPNELFGLEAELRDSLRTQFGRGHVQVHVRWSDEGGLPLGRAFDRAADAVVALRELQQRFGLQGEVTVDLVARYAEASAHRAEPEDVPARWPELEPVVMHAAASCRAAREREGEALRGELLQRLEHLHSAARRIAEQAPGRVLREHKRLRDAVHRLLEGRQVDDSRVAQELALAADRLDVTEELVRLDAHLDASVHCLREGGQVGKQLGFLAQEMGREVNTIGAKANDAHIAHEVVGMKVELEKIREQLENLE